MKPISTLQGLFFIVLMFWSVQVFGQVTVLDEALNDGVIPAGWSQTDVNFQTSTGGYARFVDSNSTLTTSVFNGSSYDALSISFEVAKFGAGADGPITVEYSLDDGSTWVSLGNSLTPIDENYLSASFYLSMASATMQIRFNRSNSPSQKRLRAVVVQGFVSVASAYCPASLMTSSANEIAITKVSLNTIDNTSDLSDTVSGGYEDYSGITPPDLAQGFSFPISVSIVDSGSMNVDIWVFTDWNKDADFEENDEAILIAQDVSTGMYTTTVVIPETAYLGHTRMRIVAINNDTGLQSPCNSNANFVNKNGEVEDYIINIRLEGWQITAENSPFVIDFDSSQLNVNEGSFEGSGFSANPGNGQLDSDSWSINGLSDGDLIFGDTETAGDFARGVSADSESTGGIYAFETSAGNFSLGLQPTATDFTPGEIILKIQNRTGTTINAIKLNYKILVYNDQDRSNSFNFSFSTDNSTYVGVSNLAFTSTEIADASPGWNEISRETSLTGLSIPNDDFFYFKWSSDNVSGSGSVDQFALDDIRIRVNPNDIPLITVSSNSISNLNAEPLSDASEEQSFTVTGANLQDAVNLSLNPTSNFEMSLNPTTSYTHQLSLIESSALVNETIYVRLKANATEGNYSEEIVLSSNNADSQFVTLNGRAKEKLELFISEVVNPADVPNAKYVELYNAGVDTLFLSGSSHYFSIQSNAGFIQSFEIADDIPPKTYYIIDSSNNDAFETTYAMSSDLEVSSFLGNGNDSYFLSTSGPNEHDTINDMYDIYGELGKDGVTEAWNYDDSRVYRKNPSVKQSNIIWEDTEWQIISSPTTPTDMTPGYGDNDFIYANDTEGWNAIGLGNPNTLSSDFLQNIFIRSGTVSLNTDTDVGDLVVRAGATLELEPGMILKVNGDILNEGTIIFKSNATSTAVLEAVSSNSRAVGDGFEVHRRIPVQNGVRAFRYLSASVTTTSTINDNWQEGASNGNLNPNPGFGTHITGAAGTVGQMSSNGFDKTSTGFASMFFWDESENNSTPETDQIGWTSIPNTNAQAFSAGDAYAILIRGDRSSTLNSNTQTGPSTTLRTTGQIHVGDYSVPNLSPVTGHFNLVGNPYQSQVDLVNLIQNHSNDVRQDFVYTWDPRLGSLGGYAVLDLNLATISTVIEFGNATPSSSDSNQYLQPQQAFFIKTNGANPQITFTESTKNNGEAQTAVFGEGSINLSVLDVNLTDNNDKTYDGIRMVYGHSYSNNFDHLDAVKFWNFSDNLCIVSNTNYLSIEKRNKPTNDEVTALNLYGLSLDSYALQAHFYADHPHFSIYLKDNYTGAYEEILPDLLFNYPFTVDQNIPQSISSQRFEILYSNSTLGTTNGQSEKIVVYPNPVTSDVITLVMDGSTENIIHKIALYGLDGKKIKTLELDDRKIDSNFKSIKIGSDVPNNAYILDINANFGNEKKKIIVYR